MTQTHQPPEAARSHRARTMRPETEPRTAAGPPPQLEEFASGDGFDDLDRDEPTWTDPRFLVPLSLFLAAVFVIGLALRANDRLDDTSVEPPVDLLVAEVSAAQARAGFDGVRVRRDGELLILEGEAPTSSDAAAIGAVARSVDGVESVDNRIVIVAGASIERAPSSTVSPPPPSLPLAARLAAAGNITFQTSSAEITDSGFTIIDGVAAILAEAPSLPVEIHGHTDSDGDSTVNQLLSQERAQAVVAALVERGIEPDRLTPIGFGESDPIEPNITAEGRAKNRRIEFALRP